MSGSYHIDPLSPASSTHYRSLGAAISDLSSGVRSDGGPANGPGMGGPVTLRLATQGLPLVEQVQIGPIPGSSATRPLRITGGPGRTAIHAPVTTAAAPAVVRLVGASHVHLDSLTLVADDALLAYGVQMTQFADSNTISNCFFLMHPAPNSIEVASIMIGQGTPAQADQGGGGNQILHNEIKGGFWAVAAHPTIGFQHVRGNRFVGNQIEGVRGYGFHLIGQDQAEVLDNTVRFEENATWGTFGIQLSHGGVFRCEGNRIIGARQIGMVFSDQNDTLGVAAPVCTVLNNVVSLDVRNQTIGHGMYFGPDCHNYQVQHNSVAVLQGTDQVALAVGGCSNFDLRNNSLAVFPPASGLAALVSNASFLAFDHNAYFSPVTGGLIEYNGFTLGAGNYQGFLGWNTHSVHGDPQYVDNLVDLHSFGVLLSGAGDPLANVALDMDGQPRDTLHPDIGADEYGLQSLDLAVEGLLQPLSATCPDSAQAVYALVRNLGAALPAPVPVQAQCAGVSTATLAGQTGAGLQAGARDTVFLGYVNTFPGGSLLVQVGCALPGDQDPGNDSLGAAFVIGMAPPAPVASPQAFCAGDSGMLHATAPLGQLGWYDAAVGGSLLGQGDSLAIGIVSSAATYWVEASDSQAGSLATTFVGGLRGQGDMWAVEAQRDLRIDSLDLHIADTASHGYWLYVIAGTYLGMETVPGAWTLLASGNLHGSGLGQATTLPLTGLSIAGGQTYSLYLRLDSTAAVHAPCPGIYANGDLRILTGTSLTGAFAGPVPGRTWNGRIHYTVEGCPSPRVAVPVQALALPVVALGPDLLLCDSASAVLDAGHPGALYLWSSGAQSQQVTVSAAGLYAVQVDVQGCLGQDSLIVSTADQPQALAIWAAVGGWGVQFTDMSLGAITWHWDFGDGSPLDSSQHPLHVYAQPGSYAVTLTVTNACGSATWQELLVVTSKAEPQPALQLVCAPNPVRDHLVLSGAYLEATAVEISLYDMQGRTLQQWQLAWPGGAFRTPLVLPEGVAGIYFLSVRMDGRGWHGRILRE